MARIRKSQMDGNGIEQEEQLKEVIEHIQELTQGLLVELVNNILIHEGGEITVQFKSENQYKPILDFIENNKYTLTVVGNKVG